jgi:hypothetical protein
MTEGDLNRYAIAATLTNLARALVVHPNEPAPKMERVLLLAAQIVDLWLQAPYCYRPCDSRFATPSEYKKYGATVVLYLSAED